MNAIRIQYLYLVLFTAFSVSGFSQVVWTDPLFAIQEDDITVYFDAKLGNGALAGYTGDVYAHTGVITDESDTPTSWRHVQGNWGTADSKVKMTNLGNDLYSISYNINSFYGIPQNEIVKKLAFVFRNVDGSIVGRDTEGGDIFYDIYSSDDEFAFQFVAPEKKSTIVEENDSLLIKIALSRKAWVKILDNQNPIYQDSTMNIEEWIFPTAFGDHSLEFSFSLDNLDTLISKKYLYLADNQTTMDPPVEIKNGINYLNSSEIIFSLTAPLKKHAFFLCPENEFTADLNYQMNKSENEPVFWIKLPISIFENGNSTYQYLIDGEITIADPFSTVVLDPWNDYEIAPEVLYELPPYPNQYATGIVTAFDPIYKQYNWEINEFQKPEISSLVIYELLLRDFLEDHSYKSLIDTLDYLDKLGINAIELLPVQEYEGNRGWGYNPSFHMALDKYYGSKEQFKSFIDKCHQRGIAVILDVVFNHAFSQSPLCQLYWDPIKFRPSAESPYLNEIAKHPFNVGYDFNHQSHYTKAWVKQVLEYWLTEFKVDGFRFDLSKGFTQINSGNDVGFWSKYDASRINILKKYADVIWDNAEDAYVILEHFAENAEEKVLADYGMMLWGNEVHAYTEAAMGYSSSLSNASYKNRGWEVPHLVSYAESHDEERMGYKISQWGNSNASYDTKNPEIFAERIVAANLVHLSIPGPKMFWQFGELGYDFSINRCEDGSIDDDCRLSNKPIRWDYFEDPDRKIIYKKLAAILELKANYPLFNTTSYTLKSDAFLKRTILQDESMDALCIANFDVNSRSTIPEFPNTGIWYDYLSGDSILVDDLSQEIILEPGEYHLFLSKPIIPSMGVFPGKTKEEHPELTIFPNPVFPGAKLTFVLDMSQLVSNIYFIDIAGRKFPAPFMQDGRIISITADYSLEPGIYFAYIILGESKISTKVMIAPQ